MALTAKPKPDASKAAAPKLPGGVLGWFKAHRTKGLLVAGGGLLLIGGLAAGTLLLLPRRGGDRKSSGAAALTALDDGNITEARRLAEELEKKPTATPAERAAALLVRGVQAAQEAESSAHDDKENSQSYLVAVKALEVARKAGFPAGHAAQGLYLLGKCLVRSRQHVTARPVLREALAANPDRQREIHFLLSSTFLHDPAPKLAEALEENRRALGGDELPLLERLQCLIQRAEIQLAGRDMAGCTATLGQIPPEARQAAEVLLLHGHLQFLQARALARATLGNAQAQLKAQQQLQDAIQTLRETQSADNGASRATRAAMFLSGLCFLELADRPAALNEFNRLGRLCPGTPEALAAQLHEGEILRAAGRTTESLVAYRKALLSITDAENFDNPWVTLEQVRNQMLSVYRDYLDAHDFPTCLDLLQRFTPLFPKERACELAAEAHADWAVQLAAQAERTVPAQAETVRRQSRQQERLAGQRYLELAHDMLADRRYPDILWLSVENFFNGHDYGHAAEVIGEYFKAEPRRGHALALAYQGESLLALGQLDAALQAFEDCRQQHEHDSATFRARLGASRVYVEKGDFPHAEARLQENLNSDILNPASAEWRESLFELGRLLHQQRRFDEAIAKLEEATTRYPDAPRALESRYLAADAYRQQARAIEKSLKDVLVENTRILRTRQIQECLAAALKLFYQLRDGLAQRQENDPIGPQEKAILRNATFAVGDCLFDLHRYDEAIKAYQSAVNRFQNTPEALAGYVQLANAFRRVNKPLEARSTLEQAKMMLGRIKDGTSFTATSIYTKKQWAGLLEQMSSG